MQMKQRLDGGKTSAQYHQINVRGTVYTFGKKKKRLAWGRLD